jgi:hypothetical protein
MQDTVYLLCKVEDDSSLSYVSEHCSLVEGIAAGRRIVENDDFDFAYSLHSDDGCKVATFAEGRIGYREWARRSGRLDYIHSVDDRYDHDIDESLG